MVFFSKIIFPKWYFGIIFLEALFALILYVLHHGHGIKAWRLHPFQLSYFRKGVYVLQMYKLDTILVTRQSCS